MLLLGLAALRPGGPNSATLAAAPTSVAFYYGPNPPMAELGHFDWIIVQPRHMRDSAPREAVDSTVLAYLSVGEMEPEQLADPGLDPRWLIGVNANWGTRITDLTQEGFQSYLIEQRMAPLWANGYRGFFLDTLDSYQAAVTDLAGRKAQAAALTALIRRMHRRFPGVKLLFNRGFDILPEVSELCSGMVAESLFAGWDQSRKTYVPVAEADRAWLLARLREVRENYGIPIVVVDYVEPGQRGAARDVARRIRDLGFLPWVANPSLDTLGVGALEIRPRRILALYDGQTSTQGLEYAKTHRLLTPILEYLGFTVDYADLRQPLPEQPLNDRYRGIVAWLEGDLGERAPAYERWLGQQVLAGLRVALLGRPGFAGTGGWLARLGIAASPGKLSGPPAIRLADDTLVGFEAPVRPKTRGLPVGARRKLSSDLR
jgi:hypothetical protein